MAAKNRPEDRRSGLPGSKVVSEYPRKSGAATPQGHVSVQLRCSQGVSARALVTQRNSRSSRRAHHFRHHLCGPLHNQPPYATLGLAATSILILIVAPHP